MLITVGIHENLVLSDKSKINEHGTLELAIKVVEDDKAVFEALMSNQVIASMESSFRIYPPNLIGFEKEVRKSADIAKDLSVMRHQLSQYGQLYGTKEEVATAIGGGMMFAGLGIPEEDLPKAYASLINKDFLVRVVTNLQTKFLDFLKSKNAFDGSVAFRQKFLRQSKAKNFTVISTSTFDVWVEPMTVPKDQSKVVFTQYEIDKGKNDPTPAAPSAGQSGDAETAKAINLFAGEDEKGEEKTAVKPPSLFN